MTKRRAAWAGVAVALVPGLVGGLLWLTAPTDTVTEENFRRVALGMPLAEVEAVFRRPADETYAPISPPPDCHAVREPCTLRTWYGRAYTVSVFFDADGRSAYKLGYVEEFEPAPLHRRLARMIGL